MCCASPAAKLVSAVHFFNHFLRDLKIRMRVHDLPHHDFLLDLIDRLGLAEIDVIGHEDDPDAVVFRVLLHRVIDRALNLQRAQTLFHHQFRLRADAG